MLVGLRGLVTMQIDVYGANTDLHSGGFGGAVPNPLHALAELLASMHGPDGKVAVEGFYDGAVAPTPEQRACLAALPFDEEAYKAGLGLEGLAGEAGYTTLERATIRPTLEVNGMWGGFTGEGMKTVLPGEAHAKISCRLVPDQQPSNILDLLERHVQKHRPSGVRVGVQRGEALAWPYQMPADNPFNQAAADVLTELYGRPPYLMWMGGSVPVCETFLRSLGVYTVSFGFALPDERFHAPNEFFRLANFERGQVAYGKLLERLAT